MGAEFDLIKSFVCNEKGTSYLVCFSLENGLISFILAQRVLRYHLIYVQMRIPVHSSKLLSNPYNPIKNSFICISVFKYLHMHIIPLLQDDCELSS